MSGHSLSVERVGSRDDVRALPAHQEVNSIVEGLQVGLSGGHLRLLDDVQWVRGAHAQ